MDTSPPVRRPSPLRRRSLALAAAFALATAALGAAITGCSSPAPAARGDGSLRIDGAVERPMSLTAGELAALPQTTQSVSFLAGDARRSQVYRGVGVWSLLTQAGIRSNDSRHGEVLDRYLLATGADGYRAVFSLGELNPGFGRRDSLVARVAPAEGASPAPSRSEAGLRITAPGDVKGGRYVYDLVRLSVLEPASRVRAEGGNAAAVTVSGAVSRPLKLDLEALRSAPPVTVSAGGRRYVGADLWTLVGTQAGIASKAKNASVSMYLLATGSDGYRALIALAEIDPSFGAGRAVIAYEVDGAPPGRGGIARLVVEGDLKMGRSVAGLQSIEVLEAAMPP